MAAYMSTFAPGLDRGRGRKVMGLTGSEHGTGETRAGVGVRARV